ncbi:MAG: polyhydroxyalkanoate synthesis regulator DNA-binding domain-containing protein [Sandaracinaceae bacterium]
METQEHRGEDERDEPVRLIKRYANRKLYDTRDSRYVTLQQIAAYVREGQDVAIIDNTTKEDLTNVTLAQIIYEEEKKSADAPTGTSAGTLRQLIQSSGERLMTTLREGPVGKLIPRKEGDEQDVEAAEAAVEKADKPEREPRKSVFASSKEAVDELQRLADDRIRGLLGHALTHVHSLQGEVGRLQSRIDELEEKLVKLSRREEEEAGDSDASLDGEVE